MSRILLVDDEIVISMRLEEILTSMGYDVVGVAATGREAIEMAIDCHPDLILMDIVMPGELDGIDAAAKIRSEIDVPVIFITGHAKDRLIERAKQVSPFGYILKPFQENQIKVAIEIALHKKKMEEQLQKAYHELEGRVKERTSDLEKSNKKLLRQIAERQAVEEKLRKRERELKNKTKAVHETNIALEVMLKKRENDKLKMQKDVLSNVKQFIEPYLKKLKKSEMDLIQKSYLHVLDSNLKEITSPFIQTLSSELLNFTPTEIKVANLVKHGNTTKEIAEITNSTKWAVDFHRNSMRKKLGIRNKKLNLRTYLLTIT